MTDPATHAPVLSVRNLKVQFPTRTGLVKAVDDVSFDLNRGKTLCVVGESGSGKTVTARARSCRSSIGPGRIVGGSIDAAPTPTARPSISPSSTRAAATSAAIRGREIAMIFQEPMSSLSPVHTHRRPDRRGPAHPFRHGEGRAPRARARTAAAGGNPPARGSDRPLHVRVLRRHAPARHDRDGAGLQSVAADRRRADHRARRDDPGGDPRPDQAAAGRARHGGDVHHPRHGRRRRDRRRGAGDVPRQGHGGGPVEPDLPRAAGRLHAHADRLGAQARDARPRRGSIAPATADGAGPVAGRQGPQPLLLQRAEGRRRRVASASRPARRSASSANAARARPRWGAACCGSTSRSAGIIELSHARTAASSTCARPTRRDAEGLPSRDPHDLPGPGRLAQPAHDGGRRSSASRCAGNGSPGARSSTTGSPS